jgi:hypothetical protein
MAGRPPRVSAAHLADLGGPAGRPPSSPRRLDESDQAEREMEAWGRSEDAQNLASRWFHQGDQAEARQTRHDIDDQAPRPA